MPDRYLPRFCHNITTLVTQCRDVNLFADGTIDSLIAQCETCETRVMDSEVRRTEVPTWACYYLICLRHGGLHPSEQ